MGSRIWCDDCVDGMGEHVAPGSIDVVVTSPPYNIGTRYHSFDDKKPRKDYLDFMEEWGTDIRRRLKDSGSLFLNIAGKPSDPLVPFQVLERLTGSFVLQNLIVWIKSIAIQDVSHGHYRPINSMRYVNRMHEFIFHLTKYGDIHLDRLSVGVPYKDKTNIKRWDKPDMRCAGDTWYIPYQTTQKEQHHPAAFPKELPLRCIKLHGVSSETVVMDPFMGIGTTGLACMDLGCSFVGFESDPLYFQYAEESLSRSMPHVEPVGPVYEHGPAGDCPEGTAG